MKIRIRNFQSIEDVKLDISGFTLLTGESSQGKSASFRALQAAVSNRFRAGQVRNGEERCDVGIQFSDVEPILRVAKPANGSCAMKLGDVMYSKLSRTVPSEVASVVNMDVLESDRDSYSLNFHPQFEAPLLLEFSQQKVVDLLSASEALDDLNVLKGGVLDKRTELKGAFNSLDAILSRLKEEVSDLYNKVGSMRPGIESLKVDYGIYKGLCSDMDSYKALSVHVDSVGLLGARIDKVHDIIDCIEEMPDSSMINQCISNALYVRDTGSIFDHYGKVVDRLGSVVEVESCIKASGALIAMYDSVISTKEFMQSSEARIADCIRVVEGGICPICGNSVSKCNDMGTDYQELLEKYKRELGKLEAKVAVAKAKVKELCSELGLPEDVTMEQLEAKKAEIEAKRADYEVKLEAMVNDLRSMKDGDQ